MPIPQVDHKDNEHANFRLSNLRVTDAVGNNRNRRPPPRSEENRALARGVYRRVFPNGRVRYQVRLRDADGIRRSYGYYDTVEEANAVSRAIRVKLHGEHHKATPPNHRPAAQARPAAASSRPTAKKGNRKAA